MHVVTCFHVIGKKEITTKNNQSFIQYFVSDKIFIVTSSNERIEAECITAKTAAAVPLSPQLSQSNVTHWSEFYDFAILKLKKQPQTKTAGLAFISPKNSPTVGNDVVFTGFPLESEMFVTFKGMVAGYKDPFICIQAPINQGSSGSAVLNNNGEIIGFIDRREGAVNAEQWKELNTPLNPNISFEMAGVDPLKNIKNLLATQQKYISPGFGYAISVIYFREFIKANFPEIKIQVAN